MRFLSVNCPEMITKVLDQRAAALVVQTRCADVKPLWESEIEKTQYRWITHADLKWLIKSDILCVDLFTHLTYMLYSINVCRNFPHYKLESCGNE